MLKKKTICLIIFFIFCCVTVSYAQETSSKKWEISKSLGEIAIRMSPKAALLVSDQGADMAGPAPSASLKTDLVEFESLLKAGADPTLIKIAGFQAAGRRTIGPNLTVMSSGNPGRVVPAEEAGQSLFHYFLANNLPAACRLLDTYGYISPNDIDKPISAGGYDTPLLVTSEVGHTEMVKFLLAKGAQVDKATDTGATPLLIASLNGHIEIVKMLLAKGAKVNKAMDGGATPLFFASQNGQTETVKLLLAKGAQVDKGTDTGGTPLLVASIKGHTEIVKLLLAKGAKVDGTRKNGITPLYWASMNGHVEIVKLLLAKGAKVDSATSSDDPPIYWASVKGHVEIAKLLLDKGARVDNSMGKLALFSAKHSGYTEIVDLLVKHGAKE